MMFARMAKLQVIGVLALGAILGSLVTYLFLTSSNEVNAQPESAQTVKLKSDVPTGPLTVEVTLQQHYLDGEVSEENVTEVIWSMEDFWAAYSEWELVHQEEGKAVFRKQIADISPLLKTTGMFGISDEGILTIYSGSPEEENAIQSFYQIDVGKLESYQQDKLQKGIPIRTKENYQQVLESFRKYTINTSSRS